MPDLKAQLAALSPTARDALLAEVMIEANRQITRSQTPALGEFVRRQERAYQHTPFQQAIDEALMQVSDYLMTGGECGISRLAISMPPRHGKTLKVSRLWPSHLLALNPALRIIAASHSAKLAYANSRAVRSIIRSPNYREAYPHVRLATSRVDHWETSENGGLVAVGVTGAVAGFGGHVLLVDDPVASRADAESPQQRQRVKDWWQSDLITRLEMPGGVIVLMMTRWHADDLAGWLLAESGEDWHVLNFPALAEENDPLGRAIGQALWPEKYGTAWLEKRQADMGEYAFSALYQQHPIPREAGLFDASLIRIVDEAPPCIKKVRFYDLAVSAKTRADYSVGLLLGVTAAEEFAILDVWRRQLSPADIAAEIRQNAAIDGTNVPIRLEADNHARAQLDFILRDPGMRPFAIDAVSPQGDKYTRAGPAASRVNAGRFLMVRGKWNRAFLDEIALFPAGANDDQVDALSGAYNELATRRPQVQRVSVSGLYPSNRLKEKEYPFQ